MQLIERASLGGWELDTVGASVPKEDMQDLLTKSHTFFVVEDQGNLIAIGGLMSPRMIAAEVYLWLVLRPGSFSLSQIREGVKLARKYLGSLPWEVRAETAKECERTGSFARSVGFRKVSEIDERNIYVWGL